jgi:hypothetical protein
VGLVRALVRTLPVIPEFVFGGAGPLYGVAMFSAAKMLEASGDPAMAQETEEWATCNILAPPRHAHHPDAR